MRVILTRYRKANETEPEAEDAPDSSPRSTSELFKDASYTTQLRAHFAGERQRHRGETSLRRSVIDHHMRTESHHELHAAAEDLSDFCACLPGDESSERCRVALEYLEDQIAGSLAACETGRQGAACERLERLESVVRELDTASGGFDPLITTLGVLSRLEKKTAARRGAGAVADTPTPVMPMEGITVKDIRQLPHTQRAVACRSLFADFDLDGNGLLDVSEFRECMKALGMELDGHEVELVFQSFSDRPAIMGIDPETFQEIVECEEMRSTSSIANYARRSALKNGPSSGSSSFLL